MWKRYNAFLRRPPEVVLDWRDPETGARGWLVINSLRGGAAGGGTRMRPGITPREVVYLAKAMDLKFALSGPTIGGAKAGLDFDPADPRKPAVLERWYRAIMPYLRECYGTGGDLNVDEVRDVIPTFQRLGLSHPQEGVVRGHLAPPGERFSRIIRNLKEGVEAPVPARLGLSGGPRVTVSDMITGYGVARAVEHFYGRLGRGLEGVRVLLEGFGNVGAACGLYLARAGARIVGIMDARSALAAPEGLDASDVEELIRRRTGTLIPPDPRTLPPAERDRFDAVPADVFVCAAVSGSLTAARMDRLAAAGVEVIASGANQPFREHRIGSTRVAQRADRRFSVLADILANCGMARTFSYLMEDAARPDAGAIFAAVDRTIVDTMDEVLERSGNRVRGLLAATLGLGLDRVGAP